MGEEIRTARLTLRRATMGDLPAVHAMLSDPRNMPYWSTLPHDSLAQSESWLRSMVEADPENSDDFIVERAGRMIGKLGCWRLPDIGFMIVADAQDQGYASEALAAFLKRRRRIGGPPRLLADVDPRNAASLRLLARHGFVEVGRASGTWQIGGASYDSVYLALQLVPEGASDVLR